ncbi:expressed protein [Phakopsora pachyrhizi]|uniref:Expressed protein n=1 Tax=Phakopsora pachyrhizi TaxID=170000 RepID=A0AAV0BQ28_PHAPC|nr:expressed protein [Phakopsora pachyrhizi]
MVRRRASAPTALVLQPSNVPLIRGAPKFILPSPPTENAIYLAIHRRLGRTSNAARVTPLKEMPRLEYPIGVYGFGTTSSRSPDSFKTRRSHSLSFLEDHPSEARSNSIDSSEYRAEFSSPSPARSED